MTIVPKQGDLIDRLIELETRNSMTEKGCGGGGEATDTPSDETAPPKVTITRDVIVNLQGARRQSGKLVFADGTFPRIGASHIVGIGVDPATYKADSVRFDGKHRWWRRSAASRGNGVAPGQRLFALPPGWWPTAANVEREVPSGVAGQPATIRVEAATGIVRYLSGPDYPPVIDLAQFGSFLAGGGACPGNDPVDPTGAGDGRQWDTCESVGEDDPNDPIVPPGASGGGGPGGGDETDWIKITDFGPGVAEEQPGLGAPETYKLHVKKAAGIVFFRGTFCITGAGSSSNPKLFKLPEGFAPETDRWPHKTVRKATTQEFTFDVWDDGTVIFAESVRPAAFYNFPMDGLFFGI